MISKDKQYTTREGLEVRIYAIDGYGDFPVHGAIKANAVWKQNCWKEDGNSNGYLFESKFDLIEIVPKVKVWVEYCLDEDGHFHTVVNLTERDYLECKAGGERYENQTHLKLDVFEYEPKPETK
jgi:hypothetical protein